MLFKGLHLHTVFLVTMFNTISGVLLHSGVGHDNPSLYSFYFSSRNLSDNNEIKIVQELHEAVKANAMKVVVVKKRQLQLYAGQPFADVEMALHSLVQGDQNAPTP